MAAPNFSVGSLMPALSTYSPISTLERQYAGYRANTNQAASSYQLNNNDLAPPMTGKSAAAPTAATAVAGKRYLFIQVNSNCCVPLDQVFRMARKPQQSPHQVETIPASQDWTTSAEPFNNNISKDPFAFLPDASDTTDATTSSKISSSLADTAPTQQHYQPKASSTKGRNRLGKFFQSIKETGSHAITAGMHSLAVRTADGAPECILIAALDQQGTVLGMTEAKAMNNDDDDDIVFSIPIPIVLSSQQHQIVTLCLCVKSTAPLVASKHYWIAQVSLDVSSSKGVNHGVLPIHNSPIITDGMVTYHIVQDGKRMNWCLPDPIVVPLSSTTTTNSNNNINNTFHNLPLDQRYAFTDGKINNGKLLLATERTVESTLILPIAAALATLYDAAVRVSLKHAHEQYRMVNEYRHDMIPSLSTSPPPPPQLQPQQPYYYADVQLRISHWQTNMASAALITGPQQRPTISVLYQRPDTIFETTVLEATSLPLYPTAADGFRKVISPRFYANAIRKEDVMPSVAAMMSNNRDDNNNSNNDTVAIGTIRLEVALLRSTADGNNNDATTTGGGSFRKNTELCEDRFECLIPLEPHLDAASTQSAWSSSPKHYSREYKLYDAQGLCMGNIVLSSLTVTLIQTPTPAMAMNTSNTAPTNIAAMEGLVELMGLQPVTDGVVPNIDLPDAILNVARPVEQRREQLKQLGFCYMSAYLEQHLNSERCKDVEQLAERASQYREAIQLAMQGMNNAAATVSGDGIPVYADRRPRPFRPSSSRTTEHLAGLGFNVHTATFSLTHNTTDDPRHPSLVMFHNVTCGAPADHARGFGKLYDAPGSNTPVAGGLRRLEAARQMIGQHITSLQNALLFKALRCLEDQSIACKRPVTHISPNNEELKILRWKLVEAVQCLHALTWACALRRTSVFSQTLGIAMTSYLANVSDPNKSASHWPDVWSKQGFLVSYEGLLSAAGKELGMIEDAAVGIDMLRQVRVILAPDDGGFAKNPNRVPVPYSQCISWIHLWTARERPGAQVEFYLQVGIDPSYFTQRVPAPLKNGVAIRLLGTLFEVGVDIFQAASNAGSNLNKNMSTAACNPVDVNDAVMQDYSVKDVLADEENAAGGDDDDEDLGDTVGISGTDALVQLNYEAFQKLNAYAHAVLPVVPKTGTHPMLATLYQHIASSAGKVNHDILVEASTLAQQLGGGGVVFCKSGKDRTAMHVTYKQMQVLQSVVQQQSEEELLRSANLIRLHGTRLPICEKNVGQAKYAFNSLQVKFMPRTLKPPMNALAGFLKGGKVFGGGGIES